MAVLDNFKNFIRHGKTAREGNGTDFNAPNSGTNLSDRQQQKEVSIEIGSENAGIVC